MPDASAIGLVVLESAFPVGAVGEDPASLYNFVVLPGANGPHTSVLPDVGADAVLFAEPPPAGVDIPVLVGEGALAVFAAVLPLPVVLALVLVGQLADPVLEVVHEFALVHVPV